jgi:hypothetical protein
MSLNLQPELGMRWVTYDYGDGWPFIVITDWGSAIPPTGVGAGQPGDAFYLPASFANLIAGTPFKQEQARASEFEQRVQARMKELAGLF